MTQETTERILRIAGVLERTGLTRSTLYRMIAADAFPRQVRLSDRYVGWRASEVEIWLMDLPAFRRPFPQGPSR